MIDLNTIKDLSLLRESHDLECKLGLGRDGQGAVPEDFWPTYSAFANTDGGVVVLGVKERNGTFQAPKLYELAEPYNQTLLELRMIDLFPKWVLELLHEMYGTRFDSLEHTERVALALAAAEGTVTHARLRAVSQGHPVDLSKTLQYLVQEHFLESTGGRGAVYHLHGFVPPTADEVFGPVQQRYRDPRSPDSTSSSPDFSKVEVTANTPRDSNGCLISYALALPIVDDLEALTSSFRSALEDQASLPRQKKAVERAVLTEVLLKLCARQYVTLRCLAGLVSRNPESLRDNYLTGLVKEKRLALAFPTTPNHERQAYCAASALKSAANS